MVDIRDFTQAPATGAKGFVNTQINSRIGGEQTPMTTENPTADRPDDELSEDLVAEYLQFLKKHDISKEDIFAVLDSLLTHGTIQWDYKLLGKIPVVFQVRPAWVNTLVLDRIQKNPPATYASFNDFVNTHNVAGSLIRYDETDFRVADEESFDQVRDFVQKLPFVIKSQLIKQLAIFDRVVAVATSDWAVENFSKPSSGA